jgi:hypothetical protein
MCGPKLHIYVTRNSIGWDSIAATIQLLCHAKYLALQPKLKFIPSSSPEFRPKTQFVPKCMKLYVRPPEIEVENPSLTSSQSQMFEF